MTTRRPFQIDGTLDIECADWDVFCLGATFDGHRARVYYQGDELIDDLRMRGGVWFAHAGGVYDLLWVLERARVRGIPCQVDRAQHRVTRIVMGGLTLRDSYSLWPAPLDELCGAIDEPVPSLPWACVCNRDCGGYCQISERAARGDPDLEAYCKADARVLYLALRHLGEWAADHRIALRGTLGQTAWIAAQDELGLPDSEIPYHLWRHARQADKGGRIAVVRPRVGAVAPEALVRWDRRSRREFEPAGWRSTSGVVGAQHDICNAYPAQLARAHLPVGACRELGGAGADRALERGLPGIYTVSVTVPDDLFLPPLPWHKAGTLCFPTGEFVGSWTLPELIAAFERGVRLRETHTALVWETTAPIFAPLVERWYEIRRAAGRRTPAGQWIGGLSKALTGKLAERPDRDRVALYPDSIRVCTRSGPCSRRCSRRCGAYEQLDLYGHIWAIPYRRMSPSAYPQWSAYLRSMTRVQWLSQAERMTASTDVDERTGRPIPDGGRALCMGNTDSLWHTSRQMPEPLGDGLGQWEYQHAWTDLEVRAPTIYAFRDPADGPGGRLHVRGIPGITEADWRRGAGMLDRGIVTFGQAVGGNRGLFSRRHRRWSLPASERVWYGDRRLHSDGLTYPASAQELRELGRAIEDRRRSRDRVSGLLSGSPDVPEEATPDPRTGASTDRRGGPR